MTVHASDLSDLASAVTARPVRVLFTPELGDDGRLKDVNGSAGWDHESKSFRIELNRALLSSRKSEMNYTFWHECAHIAAGHVGPDADTPPNARRQPMRFALIENEADGVAKLMRRFLPEVNPWLVAHRRNPVWIDMGSLNDTMMRRWGNVGTGEY